MAGKYIPTHDSNKKRLSIRIEKMAPGCDTNDDIVDRIGKDVNAERIRGVDELMDNVALPIANAANPNIPTAKFSVETALLFPFLSTFVEDVNCPNTVEPRRQHAIKHEKTVPYGVPTETDGSDANLEK